MRRPVTLGVRELLTVVVLVGAGSLSAMPSAAPTAAPKAAPSTTAPNVTPTQRYVSDPAASTLEFAFKQAGAENLGRFNRFTTTLTWLPGRPAASGIDVSVEIASLDTRDQERDGILRGADLFDAAKFPAARFIANALVPAGKDRYRARGRLTIRGVTRSVTVPLTVTFATAGARRVARISGEVQINRLDFGVGRGEWQSTEWVGNAVKVRFVQTLVASSAKPAAPATTRPPS